MWVWKTTNKISREVCKEHREQFIQHKMGMQVTHSLCTKIQEAGNLQADQGRCWPDSGNIVQEKGDWDHRGRSLPGPHPHACKNTTQIFCIRNHGVSERKKLSYDLWEACEPKIQIWKSSLLVQRILCWYGRKECKPNCGVYKTSAWRRQTGRPVKNSGSWWICNKEEKEVIGNADDRPLTRFHAYREE